MYSIYDLDSLAHIFESLDEDELAYVLENRLSKLRKNKPRTNAEPFAKTGWRNRYSIDSGARSPPQGIMD